MLFTWLSRDGRLLFASKIVRSLGYGFLSVTLAIYLDLIGLDRVQIGTILMATLVNSVIFTFISSFWADRFGRRKMVIIFGLLMSLAGLLFYFTENYLLLIHLLLYQ